MNNAMSNIIMSMICQFTQSIFLCRADMIKTNGKGSHLIVASVIIVFIVSVVIWVVVSFWALWLC